MHVACVTYLHFACVTFAFHCVNFGSVTCAFDGKIPSTEGTLSIIVVSFALYLPSLRNVHELVPRLFRTLYRASAARSRHWCVMRGRRWEWCVRVRNILQVLGFRSSTIKLSYCRIDSNVDFGSDGNECHISKPWINVSFRGTTSPTFPQNCWVD